MIWITATYYRLSNRKCVHMIERCGRGIVNEKKIKSASLKGLMEWMSVEMKSRMRATPP